MAKILVNMQDPRKIDYFYEEAIKTLRTNLMFSGKNVKKILLTSAFPNEGKSDVTIQLAKEFGNIGKRVVIIDADIRRSCLLSRYSVQEKVMGLSHYLGGMAEIDDVICQTSFKNVDIIFAGWAALNPSELLQDVAFDELLSALTKEYDYIFIDTPPMMSVIDAAVVAAKCDGAVLVIESGRVSYRVSQKCQEQLAKAHCRLLGTVLNKVDVQKDKYYHRYGYYNKGYYKQYTKENK